MKVLILGSGGREHAFAWKLSQSPKVTKLYIAPGNAGTETVGTNVNISATDFESIKTLVLEKSIDMVVVGPEDPLVKGIHDYFLADLQLKKIPVIGPQKSGAQLEGSKEFSKKFMEKHNIPTAKYKSFSKENITDGYRFLESLKPPYVLKADGLAAGKGVLILNDLNEAKNELSMMIENQKFGTASSTVVVEEFLTGIELSVFVLTDGKSYKILPSAKDYKRIGEGDTGLNTGGMGAVSPVPFATDEFIKKVEDRIVVPTINGLIKDGIDYKGFIFIGLMNDGGNPFVIEYNVRMGDPETEVVIPRIKSDLMNLFEGVANQNLHEKSFEVDARTATTVMLVSGGYPEDYEKGKKITHLDLVKDSIVFHAGTTKKDNEIITNGGRVMAITSLGENIKQAVSQSFLNAECIKYDKKYYRKDIGIDLLSFTKN
ncbi:MAG: phosphoribosylamine--glycine ligase [Flavobacteriales bacterium]|nr:phosphoribosylamine--glycine ligase [Flavobacteriales bacterium]